MLASNIMDAAGMDSKLATQISAGLNILAGTIMMFTPLAGIGASLIGAGIGSFTGSILGGYLGGKAYEGLKNAGKISFETSPKIF